MVTNSIDLNQLVRPDAKGRLYLGYITQGISSYKISLDEKSREIHLTPYVEIPLSEQWLFDDIKALQSVTRGLQQSQNQEVIEHLSFQEHLDTSDHNT